LLSSNYSRSFNREPVVMSSSSIPQANLAANPRPPKRHVTTHDATSGKSIYADFPEPHYFTIPGFAKVARLYATRSLPAQLTEEDDMKAYMSESGVASYLDPSPVVRKPADQDFESIGQAPGANVVMLELIPGAVGHWHRTLSLDVSICLSGEIDHELDSGEKVRLSPG
jgi:quercetin dioxygenase-like cupin family protein